MKEHIANNIESLQEDIVEGLNLLGDWNDKYEVIIEYGERAPTFPEVLRTDKNLVQGCQSKVWVVGEVVDGIIEFHTDGDSPIPKGLAAILSSILSGHRPDEVATTTISFHTQTELIYYLSPLRVKGLAAMIQRFQDIGKNYS